MKKTYKSIAKRFRITKKGKIIHRKTGLDHFRTKKSGKYVLNKRRKKELSKELKRAIAKILKK
jgi:large subunit ribosomal protein L35